MNKAPFKILLCLLPAYDKKYPPLGLAALVAFLKSNGVAAFQEDLNINFSEYLKKNRLEFVLTKKFKNDKIKNRVYYYQDLKYSNKNGFSAPYAFERVPGAAFDFTEKLLSSKNLHRYINDEKENIFYNFFRSELTNRIKKEKFDMLGFSIIAPSQVISAFTLGRIIKFEVPDLPVVIGGQWVSLFKEELLKRKDFSAFYDYIIYSEGETPLYSLINSIKTGRSLSDVPNLIYKEKNKFIFSKQLSDEDMNKLPCPDFDGLPLKKYTSSENGKICSLTFETARSCYWNKCIFCTDCPLPKSRYREKDAKLLIEDIKTLKQKYKTNRFTITNAVISPWQIEKFSKGLIEHKIKIKWWGWVRFEKEFTKELLSLVKKSGCYNLGFGLESMNQRVLDFCDKGTKVEIIKRIIKDLRDIKLGVILQAMVGLPGETTKEALDTISFLRNYSESTIFNSYHLIPKALVFNNPEKYGMEIRKNSRLPFRFFYPFRQTLGNRIDRGRAEEIIKFYERISVPSKEIPSRMSPNKSVNKLKFNKTVKNKDLVFSLLCSRYVREQKYSKATEILEKFSKKFPNAEGLYQELFKYYFILKRYDKAIEAANRLLGLGYNVIRL